MFVIPYSNVRKLRGPCGGLADPEGKDSGEGRATNQISLGRTRGPVIRSESSLEPGSSGVM